jgi:hypothetical protein
VPRQSRGVIAEASLSIGKQTSARIWAGLQLVVQSRHEIFDDGGFRSGRRSRRRAPRYPREGRRNDAPRSTAAEAKRVSPTSLRGCG